MHPRKVENCSNCTDQVIFRDSILETKRIKQLLLLFQSPHHCSPPTRIASEQGNHCSLESPKSFATKSAISRPRPSTSTNRNERLSVAPIRRVAPVLVARRDWPVRSP